MKLWYCKAIERPIHRRPALPPELQLPYIYVWNKNIKTAHPVPVSEICELYAEFKKKKKATLLLSFPSSCTLSYTECYTMHLLANIVIAN